MIEAKVKLKAWGNSIGLVLPKDALQKDNLGVNDEVEITIRRTSNPLREIFGKLKDFPARNNKTNAELLAEMKRDLHGKYL